MTTPIRCADMDIIYKGFPGNRMVGKRWTICWGMVTVDSSTPVIGLIKKHSGQ